METNEETSARRADLERRMERLGIDDRSIVAILAMEAGLRGVYIDELKAAAERIHHAEELLRDAYRWVLSEHVDGIDGACEQCMGAPTGNDYVCVPHRAKAAMEEE